MPGINSDPNTLFSPTPWSRKSRTGLELTTHEVDRIASLGGEQKATKREEWTKVGPRRDEHPQGKLTENPDTVRKKRMLIEDITHPHNMFPVEGRGRPEPYGWWDRGRSPSAVHLYSGHEPEDAGNKVKRRSCRLRSWTRQRSRLRPRSQRVIAKQSRRPHRPELGNWPTTTAHIVTAPVGPVCGHV